MKITYNFRTTLRKISFLRLLYQNLIFFKHALREGLWKVLFTFTKKTRYEEYQSILTWNVSSPVINDLQSLKKWFQDNGVSFQEGRFAIYIAPQPALKKIIPDIVAFYPPQAGFKILKDFHAPNDANYIADSLIIRRTLVGKPVQQLISANYLFAHGLGARVWDVCHWKMQKQSLTVFVVEHIDGYPPSNDECRLFIVELENVIHTTHLRILLPNWKNNPEFQCPSCNHNLIFSIEKEKAQYIDFQNFGITSSSNWTSDTLAHAKDIFHFGGGRTLRGKHYLYQSVPGMPYAGKRNTIKRWMVVKDVLNSINVNLDERLILDIGCNAGLMLYFALCDGAKWGLGWDRPAVINHTQSLLFSLGMSRFYLHGANLSSSYPLYRDIPQHLRPLLPESIVFYLSVHQHIGLLHDLQHNIPWRVLLFEGHQNETLDDIYALLASWIGQEIKIHTATYVGDGDSSNRPFVILMRQ